MRQKRINAAKVMNCNYNNLKEVQELSIHLGRDHIVIKRPDKKTFSITTKKRTYMFKPEWVVYEQE